MAIVRLGGEGYKEICAQLRVTSLSSGKGYGMKTHIGAAKAEILRKAKLLNRYDFFPLLCQIFATDKERDIKKFFSQPVKVIKEELTLIKEENDQTSFAVLALFVIYNNCITDAVLSPTSDIKTVLSDIAEECEMLTQLNIKVVRKHLDIFLHSYVKKSGSSYMIMHDKLFDIFVSFYGEHLLDIILTHCSYPIIFTRFQLQPLEVADKCMIEIPLGKEAKYFERLFHVSDPGDFANIFWHNQLKYRTFRKHFLKFLEEDPGCRELCLSLSDTASSPLIIAAARGYTNIIHVLLDVGMNVNVYDDYDLTPLSYAAASGRFETVKLLLENNFDINKQHNHKHFSNEALAFAHFFSIYYHTANFSIGMIPKSLSKTVTFLQKNKVDQSSGTYWRTPLYLASTFGHTDIVELLLKQNYDIDSHDCFNFTPLYVAALCNHIETVKILVKHGCDINMCNDENESPLYVASKWGNVDIVKLLLDNNCIINICNEKRESPLHAALNCMGCIERPYFLGKPFELFLRLLNYKRMKVQNEDYVEIV
ncbi:unnamed protein product [Mytilus coruscus]|uniref:Uncharacterized protein n=1 Tax=Mytilus coruscus TaxID=42192 RepID=A0A6J8ATY7_MYTCO|nr:unnamed protein product [Mytilus coruscus]